jgi:hypothetical protein
MSQRQSVPVPRSHGQHCQAHDDKHDRDGGAEVCHALMLRLRVEGAGPTLRRTLSGVSDGPSTQDRGTAERPGIGLTGPVAYAAAAWWGIKAGVSCRHADTRTMRFSAAGNAWKAASSPCTGRGVIGTVARSNRSVPLMARSQAPR